MWLSSIEVRGLRRTPPDTLERTSSVGADAIGPLADALQLWVSALDPERAPETLEWMGWGGTCSDRQAEIARPWAVRQALGEGPQPKVVVDAVIQLDPPLFGRVREHVLRDPQLAGGLSDGTIRVRAGWLFTPDCGVASLDRIGVMLGSVAVPVSDKPKWLDPLLADIASRVIVLDWRAPIQDVAARLQKAILSPDPWMRAAAKRALAAPGQEPFGMDPLECVDAGVPALAVGPDLEPLRWYGRRGDAVARLAEAAYLQQPDVLVLPYAPSEDIAAWLMMQTEGDEATLEQVITA